MANKRIDELPSDTSPTTDSLIAISRDGVTQSTKLSDIAEAIKSTIQFEVLKKLLELEGSSIGGGIHFLTDAHAVVEGGRSTLTRSVPFIFPAERTSYTKPVGAPKIGVDPPTNDLSLSIAKNLRSWSVTINRGVYGIFYVERADAPGRSRVRYHGHNPDTDMGSSTLEMSSFLDIMDANATKTGHAGGSPGVGWGSQKSGFGYSNKGKVLSALTNERYERYKSITIRHDFHRHIRGGVKTRKTSEVEASYAYAIFFKFE